VRLIREEVDRCRRILDDMAARVSEPAGEMALATTVVAIAQAAVAALGPDDRGRVDVDVPDDLPVAWPSGVVIRMLVNLVRNGLQASGDTSRVQIRARPLADDSVSLQVVDTGSGMSPTVRTRVGEPFFTTKPAGSGMGLGLFVTRTAIDQLGGSLAIESQEGRGTTVTITLPRQLARSERT
jgi:two-component system sensor histidine kinase RegB